MGCGGGPHIRSMAAFDYEVGRGSPAHSTFPGNTMGSVIRFINELEMKIAKGLLAAIVVLVFLAAIFRWFGLPLVWSVDSAQLLFVWACFIGADQALVRNRHIGVDFLTRRMSGNINHLLSIATYLLILAFLLIVLIYGINLCIESRYRRFNGMDLSFVWATSSAPVGALLMIKTVLISLAEKFGMFQSAQLKG
jgi:TRAP-type C4-dicarboxylate transport system permease small subunit